jgi:hypothetical protein
MTRCVLFLRLQAQEGKEIDEAAHTRLETGLLFERNDLTFAN